MSDQVWLELIAVVRSAWPFGCAAIGLACTVASASLWRDGEWTAALAVGWVAVITTLAAAFALALTWAPVVHRG